MLLRFAANPFILGRAICPLLCTSGVLSSTHAPPPPEPMTSAFAIGCGVAGAAYALKGVLHVGSKLAQNPEAMKQAAALGAGLRGAGSVFKVPSFLSFTKHAGGFDAVMNRREAALILNCRRLLPAQLAAVCARAPARACPSTSAASLGVPPTPCTCTSRRVRVQE